METMEMIASAALLLSLLLWTKIFGLQRRIRDLESDLEWMRQRPESSPTYTSGKPPAVDPSPDPPVDRLDAELEERLRMLLASGQKVKAIKELRVARNITLLEAKNYVEDMERNH
ncbi:hypothetical protein [Paenibacillus sp. DMB20]|uniref:hypothetical protein n=1 Tax=Paenibacillus sp. DMB20 TaxID=1642570 RepID=UPI000627A889|nr:hypothetical protein [Paenibacillus sp. DMB20]KKO52843.1 hypothetical protein XI25_16505 [Paenibacillus sp. DMB20]KKO53803.1 hypothetical protein XI25_12660 [Paenibacillus sp. DMB20]